MSMLRKIFTIKGIGNAGLLGAVLGERSAFSILSENTVQKSVERLPRRKTARAARRCMVLRQRERPYHHVRS